MKESILHYVWQYKLFDAINLTTTDGDSVEIIDTGKPNTDAGPDFFNAKVKIGNTLWAGNIEIHTSSGEWLKHGHQTDKAYDSIILHVVKKADIEVFRQDGEKIPQLVLTYPDRIDSAYEQLIKEQKWVACAGKIQNVPSIFVNSWKTTLLTERLEMKIKAIESLLDANVMHWEEAFYVTLARSFGFGTNSQAFELLARSLPLSILGKHKNNLLQIESLLFGQAGLLTDDHEDEYFKTLKKEYLFLKEKYSLNGLNTEQWKLLRLRPDNFPHIRIAQFSVLIHNSVKLFSKIIENPDTIYLNKLFTTEPSEYWKTHYLFGHTSPEKAKHLGKESVNSIIINTVVPFLFCYAYKKNIQTLKDKALQILETLPAERNAIITGWKNQGLEVTSAFDTQALLHLKKYYCDDKKCLRCRIGHKVLTV